MQDLSQSENGQGCGKGKSMPSSKLDRFQSLKLLYTIASLETYDRNTISTKIFKQEGNRSCHNKNSDSQVTLRKGKTKVIPFNVPRFDSDREIFFSGLHLPEKFLRLT